MESNSSGAKPPALIPGNSQLNSLITPEIKNDEFYNLIYQVSRAERLGSVLEIGSSSGEGSTEAFVRGLRENPSRPTLYCIEMSRVRFAALRERYAREAFVKPYNVSSVSAEKFPPEEMVRTFYRESGARVWREYSVETVVGWLRQDLEYVRFARETGMGVDGIEQIKKENGIEQFGLVLIDGSEFTGSAELDEVIGADWILLDDILTFKNSGNFARMKGDARYAMVAGNAMVRNGYAVFRRKA